jgi:hypothetical protein
LVDLRRIVKGEAGALREGERIDPTKLSDKELHAAIVDGLPRVE